MSQACSRAVAITTTLLAAVTLVGCSGAAASMDATTADEPSATSVLRGAEFGLAQGSAAEVPYDEATQTGGHQDALDATAVVPWVSEDDVVTVEVTPISVEKGSLDDWGWDAESATTVAGASVYYVRYRMSYVNGPVLHNVAGGWFELADGLDVVTDDLSRRAGDGPCGDEYQVGSFGKGAYLESCAPLFVARGNPVPDTILWQAPVDDAAPAPQASWPLP